MTEQIGNFPVILSAPTSLISRYLLSAINLGNIEYVSSDLDWVAGLLSNFEMPPNMLNELLNNYAKTIKEVVGESADPVVDWLYVIAGKFEEEES